MEKSRKIKEIMNCYACNYNCSTNSEFKRHLLTAKHKRLTTTNTKSRKIKESYICDCGKVYVHLSSLHKHKKTCTLIANSIIIPRTSGELPEEKPSMMDFITQNKEIMDALVLQNEELMRQNRELSNTIRELVPRIGNNKIGRAHV